MKLTILLFDGFTALDVVGGYEVLSHLPGMQVEFVARQAGLVAADSGALGMYASVALDQVHDTHILYVPGGPGVHAALADPGIVAFVQRLSNEAAWTFGICNGVAILGAAGLLQGKSVTTNWFAREQVAAYGAKVLQQRYVRDGKLVTGAGVSSSIDAALFLAGEIGGEEVARTIQLGIEYYPDPPFGSGTPDTEPEGRQHIIASVEKNSERQLARRHIPFDNLTASAAPTPATPGRQTAPH